LGKREKRAGEVRPDGTENQQDFNDPYPTRPLFISSGIKNSQTMDQKKKEKEVSSPSMEAPEDPAKRDLLVQIHCRRKGLGKGRNVVNKEKNP